MNCWSWRKFEEQDYQPEETRKWSTARKIQLSIAATCMRISLSRHKFENYDARQVVCRNYERARRCNA
jgi:hypothetical protein